MIIDKVIQKKKQNYCNLITLIIQLENKKLTRNYQNFKKRFKKYTSDIYGGASKFYYHVGC